MGIPLVGGMPPVSKALLRRLGLLDASEFVTGADTLIQTGTNGAWTVAHGTISRAANQLFTFATGSLQWDSVVSAGSDNIELVVAGPFKAGKKYFAQLLIRPDSAGGASYAVGFGDYANSDKAQTGAMFPAYKDATTALALGVVWIPTADRQTAVIRLYTQASGETTLVGWARAYQAESPQPLWDAAANTAIWPIIAIDTGFMFAYSEGAFGSARRLYYNGTGLYENGDGTAGWDAYNDSGGLGYGEGNGALGDLRDSGLDFETGPDYVGVYVSEKDADTVQMYADTSGGYMIELRDRAGKGWASSTDGVVQGKITDSFQWALTKSGVLSVATNVAAHWQTPAKVIVDEVRCHVGTAPTGQPILVDVNVNGTTIFTTQAHRPSIAAAATDATSGTADGGTSIAKDSVISVDVDQVGSGVAGSDLTVFIRGRLIW